ncbi:hypothetical protein CYMTET_13829 [Cymbomonas tetramitiformis]|uniref:Uncharacterized protein n=1 Tax=Cymbomonas tetramitiformis TaxID=36881 RepID=A0AAE0GHM6_9CHLO|nr:hypothetical protein CYMTET_13829 [Cymbomonas tetramitiformis]
MIPTSTNPAEQQIPRIATGDAAKPEIATSNTIDENINGIHSVPAAHTCIPTDRQPLDILLHVKLLVHKKRDVDANASLPPGSAHAIAGGLTQCAGNTEGEFIECQIISNCKLETGHTAGIGNTTDFTRSGPHHNKKNSTAHPAIAASTAACLASTTNDDQWMIQFEPTSSETEHVPHYPEHISDTNKAENTSALASTAIDCPETDGKTRTMPAASSVDTDVTFSAPESGPGAKCANTAQDILIGAPVSKSSSFTVDGDQTARAADPNTACWKVGSNMHSAAGRTKNELQPVNGAKGMKRVVQKPLATTQVQHTAIEDAASSAADDAAVAGVDGQQNNRHRSPTPPPPSATPTSPTDSSTATTNEHATANSMTNSHMHSTTNPSADASSVYVDGPPLDERVQGYPLHQQYYQVLPNEYADAYDASKLNPYTQDFVPSFFAPGGYECGGTVFFPNSGGMMYGAQVPMSMVVVSPPPPLIAFHT